MKVLFLTIGSSSLSSGGIYSDLIREFRDRGDALSMVCPVERRSRKATELVNEEGIETLRVRIGNITKTNLLEKGISTILLESQFISAIETHLPRTRFDLIVYSTPPITFERVVQHVKRRDRCKSYLLLKDIFPQNAVDLEMLKPNGLVWRYFRAKEKRLYALSDWIGCMSPANVAYLLAHNPEICREKVEVCPNSIRPLPQDSLGEKHPEVRDAWGIPRDAMVLVFGGNLGKPQGLEFLVKALDRLRNRRDVCFIIVGSGTEYGRIEAHLESGRHPNAKILHSLPKDQYDLLLRESDVGLILLDPRFTIPNFPSRLTAYMESGKPILAATDLATDLKDVLREAGCGLWVKNGDLDGFEAAINRLGSDPLLRHKMGSNGRAYLEQNYTVSGTYDIITAHLR